MIGKAWLSKQLRQISVRGIAIEVVAQISSKLAAGIRHSVRPLPRLRIQHDPRRLDTRRGDHDGAPVHLHFLFRLAVDVRDARGLPVLIDEDILRQRIRSQFQVLCRLRFGQQEIWSREKSSNIAACGALPAKMARRMTFMRLRQLCATVGKIRHSHFLAASLKNVIEASKIERRQIRTVGIAGPILHRTRHANHFLDPRVVTG